MKFSIVRTEYALTLPSVWCEPSLFALFIALSLVLLLVLSFLLLVFRLRFPFTRPIINIHIPATGHLPCTDKSVLTTRVGCLRLCIVSITLGQRLDSVVETYVDIGEQITHNLLPVGTR